MDDFKLMIPGPIQPDQKVMDAMGSPVQAHYGSDWTQLYNRTTSMLNPLFGTQGDVFLMVGSGSCGIDACIGSAFKSGEKVIVGINGFFGLRLKNIAENYGLKVVPVEFEWGQPLTTDAFKKAIQANQDAVGVAIVHLETSTTIINPIAEIGQIVRKHGLLYFVDAVSSLGGLPVKMDEWCIDICASASQKCLGAPPGLSPVAVGQHGWEVIDRNPDKGHGWYGNLRVWKQFKIEWGDWHPFPITMATNNVLALKASLDELLEEGIDKRMQRYQSLAIRLRKGLRSINMTPYTSDEMMAPIITAAVGPSGVLTSKIVSYMADVHRIRIAGGLGELKDKIFRIGHMSPTVSEQDIDHVVEALASFPVV